MRAKPVRYSVKLARRFCARLAAGSSRISLHRQAWTPAPGTVVRWLAAHPEFRRMYDAACARRALAAARAGLRDPGVRGRPSRYTDELAERICGLVAEGWTLRAIAARDDTPSLTTIHNWQLEHEDFRRGYLAAFEQHALLVAEETVEIADKALGDGWTTAPDGKPPITAREALMHAKLKIGARNGRVGRMAPKISSLRTPEPKWAYEDLLAALE